MSHGDEYFGRSGLVPSRMNARNVERDSLQLRSTTAPRTLTRQFSHLDQTMAFTHVAASLPRDSTLSIVSEVVNPTLTTALC